MDTSISIGIPLCAEIAGGMNGRSSLTRNFCSCSPAASGLPEGLENTARLSSIVDLGWSESPLNFCSESGSPPGSSSSPGNRSWNDNDIGFRSEKAVLHLVALQSFAKAIRKQKT